MQHLTSVADQTVRVVALDTVVELGLLANERAAEIKAVAISSTGVRLEAVALAVYVPEVGWLLHGHCPGALSISATAPLFVEVAVTDLGTWLLQVEVLFTSDYFAGI